MLQKFVLLIFGHYLVVKNFQLQKLDFNKFQLV